MDKSIDDFVVVRMPSDGDCFYHAFIQGVGLQETPLDLRRKVVKVLKNDATLLENLIDEWKDHDVLLKNEKVDMDEVSLLIIQDKEWATSTIIHILANLYNVKVVVFKKISGKYHAETFPHSWTFDEKKRKFNKVIYILSDYAHFDLLKLAPKPSRTIASPAPVKLGGSSSSGVTPSNTSSAFLSLAVALTALTYLL